MGKAVVIPKAQEADMKEKFKINQFKPYGFRHDLYQQDAARCQDGSVSINNCKRNFILVFKAVASKCSQKTSDSAKRNRMDFSFPKCSRLLL